MPWHLPWVIELKLLSMKTALYSTVLGIAVLVAAGSSGAGPAQTPERSDASTPVRYWLHPKLGMVRVDPVTLQMLKPGRHAATQPQPTPKSAA